MHTKLIGTFGLNEEEIMFIREHLPQKECEIMAAYNVTDIIAVSEFAAIVNTNKINQHDLAMLFEFYTEIAPFSETVIFLGDVIIPADLTGYIAVYKDFDDLKDNLKYILLSAYRKQKKSANFSNTLSNVILVLSVIRRHPYVTSAELAEKLGLSRRSIQRYIETLRVAGEWIEYDSNRKGWYLQEGKSVLWGDFGEK